MMTLITSIVVLLLYGSVKGDTALNRINDVITLPFPNDNVILGVGGLVYDSTTNVWTASSENIQGSSLDDKFPLSSVPRVYHMNLNFSIGKVDFLDQDTAVTVKSPDGLKIEDIALVPSLKPDENYDVHYDDSKWDRSRTQYWLVSEANSHLVKTNKFFSKNFGSPDLSTYDRETFSNSRLIRINGDTGKIIEEAHVPDFVQWDLSYSWASRECTGNRPFQGLHAISIVPSLIYTNYDHIMFVGAQSALYQDGNSPTKFSGSATRILVYGIHSLDKATNTSNSTAKYIKSFRYDTSQLTMKSYQMGARHFNALFGILALNETALLVSECEDLLGFGKSDHLVMNRIFFVELEETVDHCPSLLDCNVPVPTKRLLWEREDTVQLDGLSWGPVTQEGLRTVVLSFEDDANIGVQFEQFSLNEDEIANANVWKVVDDRDDILKTRTLALVLSSILVLLMAVGQYICVKRLSRYTEKAKNVIKTEITEETEKSPSKCSAVHYAIVTAMMNSFVVGGLTFGYSGVVLMMRKEGIYATNCACGSFCAGQKEKTAQMSTAGFAVAIGSRLLVGMFLDSQGPKLTAIICGLTCLSGFLMISFSSQDQLSVIILPAWILLSLGGSGLHLTGFHFTNLFKGDAKKKASAGISAAFGASSAIFPLMQVFNQYTGAKIQTMAKIYSVVVFFLIINNVLIQPWVKVQAGMPFKINTDVFSTQWWQRDAKKKPILSSVLGSIAKFDFWGESLFYSVSLLLLTHYISTVAPMNFEKGDIPFTTNPNNWSDYLITKMAGWFNALGFLWFPMVNYILTNFKWSQSYLVLSLLSIIVAGIVLIPSLELQIVGSIILSMTRLMLFSFHHAYVLDVFGIEHFGTLNGISSLLAAIIVLSSYPLQLFALNTNYAMSFIPIGVALILATSFPIILGRRQILNWAETVTVDSNKFRYPKNVAEVIMLVETNSKIRCAGALHSCAPLIESEGIIMSLTKQNHILEIDVTGKTVTCEAGCRIHDLCNALVPYGLALGTLGTIDWQTISGAVMTGTHGGALTIPSLHAFVDSYTMVVSDGSIKTINRADDPQLFSAIAPSMGFFGVVVEMKLKCVPLEYLEAHLIEMPFDELVDTFENLMKSNKYTRVVVYPSIKTATIWIANPVTSRKEAKSRGATSCNGYVNFRDEHEKVWLEQYLIYCNKNKFDAADTLLRKVLDSQLDRLQHYVGQYNHVLCKERNNGIPHADIEFNFDFEKHREVLEAVRGYTSNNRVPYYNFEIRVSCGDDAMLSCCYERDSMWIDFQAKASVSKKFFGEIETLLKTIGFRKHWAKGLDNTDPEYVVKQFPRLHEFISLTQAWDPDGKFRNNQSTSWYKNICEAIGIGNYERDEKSLNTTHTQLLLQDI